MEVFLHSWQIAKEVAREQKQIDPSQDAKAIKKNKFFAWHLRHSRNKRNKGANDRNKPTKQNGTNPVFFIKALRAQQMFFMK